MKRKSPRNAGHVRDGTKGERPKPLPHLKVCTFVCTLAYSNPVNVLRIVLGVSGRIPLTYWKIAKIAVYQAGLQSQRSRN